MIQHLINTTIIWTACLLLFELWLKKERFHQLNRIFLLGSLAAGLLLPLANVRSMMPVRDFTVAPSAYWTETQARPYKTVNNYAATLQAVGAPLVKVEASPAPVDVARILWALYLMGVCVGAVIVGREGFLLWRVYARGKKRHKDGRTIVETNKSQGPYSFFNIVFVSSRQDYSDAQWALLMAHEREHGRRLHGLDNLLLIMLRIFFWAHPLPHIYHKRLLLLHEYQADEAAAVDTAEYGGFLLEQSLLYGALLLTHAFNYSPLKNRIAMLTKTKTAHAAKLKFLVVLPLFLLLLSFCTKKTEAEESTVAGNRVTFNGATIAMQSHKMLAYNYGIEAEALRKQQQAFQYLVLPDSIAYIHPWDGRPRVTKTPVMNTPVSINGRPIYGDEATWAYLPKEMKDNAGGKYLNPIFRGAENDFEQYLLAGLQDDIMWLEDGTYTLALGNIVVDDKGRIAYYEYKGIKAMPGNGIRATISAALGKRIDAKMQELLNRQALFQPATALDDKKPVNVRLGFKMKAVEVRNHVVTLSEWNGC